MRTKCFTQCLITGEEKIVIIFPSVTMDLKKYLINLTINHKRLNVENNLIMDLLRKYTFFEKKIVIAQPWHFQIYFHFLNLSVWCDNMFSKCLHLISIGLNLILFKETYWHPIYSSVIRMCAHHKEFMQLQLI